MAGLAQRPAQSPICIGTGGLGRLRRGESLPRGTRCRLTRSAAPTRSRRPEQALEQFLNAVIAKNNADFPTVQHNPEVSSMITEPSYERILGLIAEARQAGARVIQPNIYASETLDPLTRQLPPTIVVNPDKSLALAREEVFGPILSIYTDSTLDEAISIIGAKEKPLGLYVFGHDKRQIRRVITETSSGGVTINDLSLHAMSNSMGFAGVGPSGMDRYKGGLVGYHAFTNPKAVVTQSPVLARSSGHLAPPFHSDRQRKCSSGSRDYRAGDKRGPPLAESRSRERGNGATDREMPVWASQRVCSSESMAVGSVGATLAF